MENSMLKQSEHWNYNQPLTKLLSSVETCLVNKNNLVFLHCREEVHHCLVITEKGVEYVGELVIPDDLVAGGIYNRKTISEVFFN